MTSLITDYDVFCILIGPSEALSTNHGSRLDFTKAYQLEPATTTVSTTTSTNTTPTIDFTIRMQLYSTFYAHKVLKYIEDQSRPKTLLNLCRIENIGSETLMIVELKQHTVLQYRVRVSRSQPIAIQGSGTREDEPCSKFEYAWRRRIIQCTL